jgi:hypothetical protein
MAEVQVPQDAPPDGRRKDLEHLHFRPELFQKLCMLRSQEGMPSVMMRRAARHAAIGLVPVHLLAKTCM